MAEKVYFNETPITVAEHDDELFFNRTDIRDSLDYKGTIRVDENSKPVVIGNNSYYKLNDIAIGLRKMGGDRKTLVAGLLREINSVYGERLTPQSCDKLEGLDDLARHWATARMEINIARKLLEEATEKEIEFFKKLSEERGND